MSWRNGTIRVVFHIGSGKTGSSSIQGFCKRNHDRLLEQGILYPRMPDGAKNQKIMAIPVMDVLQRTLVRSVGSDLEAAHETGMKAWERAARQVRKHQPDTVLISTEFLLKASNVAYLGELAHRAFGETARLEFVAYLRTPSEHMASRIQQRFKADHELPPLETIPFAWHLDRYAALGTVTVRKFDRDQLKDRNVIADFCELVGIDDEALDHKALEINASLSAEGTILLQDYRRRHHADQKEVFTRDTRKFRSRLMAAEAANPGVFTKLRLKPEFAQFLDLETDDLRQLRERYGVALARDHGVAPASQAEIAGLVDAAQVLQHDPDLVEDLRRAVR